MCNRGIDSKKTTISDFISRRFSGYKLAQSREGIDPLRRIITPEDVRLSILSEFDIDCIVTFRDEEIVIDQQQEAGIL